MLTNGYDYIFTLSTDEVNQRLGQVMSGRKVEVIYDYKDVESGSTIKLDISLDPFQLVLPKSGGTLMNLLLPIQSGPMSIKGGALPSKSYDLTGVSLELQVELGWLGTGDEQQASGQGDDTHLVFSPSGASRSNPGYVGPVAILDPNHKLDTIGKGVLNGIVVAAMVANRDKLQYIFANVNPTPAHVDTWLQPYKWQYFVATQNGGALVFLSQLSDKAFPSAASFDGQNLSTTKNTLVLISQEAFFDNVVLPSIEKSFPSGTFTSSVNDDEAVTIANKGDFSIGKVTASTFELTTSKSGDGLAISTHGGGPLKFLFGLAKLPGASYSWSISTVNPLEFESPSFSFEKDSDPDKTHSQTIHWYDWILLVATGITGIAGLAAFIVDEVEKFFDESDAMGLETINNQVQSSIDSSVVNLTNLLSWNGPNQSFTPSEAGLSVSLYVRGDLS